MRHVALLLVFLGYFTTADAENAQDVGVQLLHALDYLRVDYPKTVSNGSVSNAEEYQEQLEFSAQVEALTRRLPKTPRHAEMLDLASQISGVVLQRQSGTKLDELAILLSGLTIAFYNIEISPHTAPDLQMGERLYKENCASCHGPEGFGDGADARSLSPPPANFHARDRQYQHDIFSLYNTISLGVTGTAMRSFGELTSEQRWALAFYVANFVFEEPQRLQGASFWKAKPVIEHLSNISQLTAMSPERALAILGEPGILALAYLRAHPDALADTQPVTRLGFAREKLRQALSSAQSGNYNEAYQRSVTAYLEGFELAEIALNTRDHALKMQIESGMTAVRTSLKKHEHVALITDQVSNVDQLLARAEKTLASKESSAWVHASGAFFILLREGIEAILVLAAIFAYLSKSAQTRSAQYIHAGWLSALLLGLFTWLLATYLIPVSGENRELIEGLTGVIAAAMLIYVGYWLHSQSNADQWKRYLSSRMAGSRSTWTLASVSFLAVYREVFETILFVEALWLQAAQIGKVYIMVGLTVAAALLAAIGWGMFRFSVRIPLKPFFKINSALIYALAVILAGKGIAALQEAGVLRTNPLNFTAIDFLGIFPTIEGIAVQFVLVAAAGIWLLVQRSQSARATKQN